MTGMIDVGGGMRGAYTAGIYDYLLDRRITFEYCLGVSAGAGNLITYLAGQRDRNRRFYLGYALRRQYMGMRNFLRRGSYVDVDYVYSTLSNTGGEDPVDFEAFFAQRSRYVVVATDARTGLPHYFTEADVHKDDLSILKASSSLPGVCRPYFINGIPYFDGGVSDPVPYRRALADGCDRVVVLLTRPADFVRKPQSHMTAMKLLLRRYPATLEALRRRYLRYNQAVAECKRLAQEGKVLLVAPADIAGMETLTKDRAAIGRLYRTGYEDARRIEDFLAVHAT